MPSQPVRLYEGWERVKEVLYEEEHRCRQKQENGWQRSAARRELKTEAPWEEVWSEIQVKGPVDGNKALEMSEKGGAGTPLAREAGSMGA